MTDQGLVEHFFRHEYSRLVAILCRRVGIDHIEAIEDAVQSALLKALENWTASGLPDNPSAWLFRVASNDLLGGLRQQTNQGHILQQIALEPSDFPDNDLFCFMDNDVRDDMLRMLFVCCDDVIPKETQLLFALKNLCGFSIREIALRVFSTEARVYKRLARARTSLRENPPNLVDLDEDQLGSRLPAVHRIIYVLFTEGYLSSHAETAVRQELCDEAIRLASLLAEHTQGQTPESHALLALMHLHRARIDARQDASGGLLLLQEQDRARWDQKRIETGLMWLAKSAQGEVFSRYHAEAGIAAEHCLAPSFDQTNWKNVAHCYALLERAAPSPVHTLNRAIAVGEAQGPRAALVILDKVNPPNGLGDSFMWAAVLADLHLRAGNNSNAKFFSEKAIASAPTTAVRVLLKRRLGIA